MTWKPAKTVGLAAGLLIGIMLVAMLYMILDSLRQQSPNLGAVVSAVIMGAAMLVTLRWALYFAGLVTLRYRLDRNGVMIRYGPAQHVVPLDAITDIVPGHQLALPNKAVAPVWPGYISRQIAWDPTRPLWIHGTTPLSQQIILMTERAMYAISPTSPERFIEDLYRRRALGAVRQIDHATTSVGVAAWGIWRDRNYWIAMLLALLLNLSLFAINVSSYRQSASDIAPAGLGLLLLPSIGGGVLLFNVVMGIILYHWERVATWLLLSAAIVVQIMLGLIAMRALW